MNILKFYFLQMISLFIKIKKVDCLLQTNILLPFDNDTVFI